MFFLFLSLWPDQQQIHEDENQSKPDEGERATAACFSAGHQNGPIAKQTYSLFYRHSCSKLEQPFLSIGKYSFPRTDSKTFVCSDWNRGNGVEVPGPLVGRKFVRVSVVRSRLVVVESSDSTTMAAQKHLRHLPRQLYCSAS